MMRHLAITAACALLCPALLGQETGKSSLAIAGTPRGERATELLQSVVYCREIERQLNKIIQRYPDLEMEAIAARAAWNVSPFVQASRVIEADISRQVGPKALDELAKGHEAALNKVLHLVSIENIGQARAFIALVGRRAKGEIEPEFVRGNLLSCYPPYRQRPQKEFEDGFTKRFFHTAKGGRQISFSVPMSWKPEDLNKPELMGFRDVYGRGPFWMTVLVNASVAQDGRAISSQAHFETYSESSLNEEYARLGITLTSFLKTKVNGMPALMFTREQAFEQLGQKRTRAAEVIRMFGHGEMISFQINTLGREGTSEAVEAIKHISPLFRMIGASVQFESAPSN